MVRAVILVCGSRVSAYGIRSMHGPIHVFDMYGTGTKHTVRYSQKSGVQWSGVAEFTCSMLFKRKQQILIYLIEKIGMVQSAIHATGHYNYLNPFMPVASQKSVFIILLGDGYLIYWFPDPPIKVE